MIFYIIRMVNKERHLNFYNLFKQNGWNGLLNVKGSPVSLIDFVNQSLTWKNDIDNINTIEVFNKFIQIYSELFAEWAIKQPLNRESKESNIRWFKGIIGEYFYIENVEDLMKQVWSHDGQNYAFEHVVPASFYRLTSHTKLEFGGDFGVDAIGINRLDEVSVAQIKCWNIFSDNLITYGDVISNMYTDGMEREWIYHKQKESMFVLWLGLTKNIAKPLANTECPVYNKVQYFGYQDLKTIHAGYPRFFDNANHFKTSLKEIGKYNVSCDPKILTMLDTL